MRIRRKLSKCENCGQTLGEVYNFCPNCGQENNDTNVSFSKLLREFFHNYFSLDSKFRNSFRPFLLSPGFITNEFNLGKRVSYANPIRLYLVMSLLYFFILNIGNNYFSDEREENLAVISGTGQDSEIDELSDSSTNVISSNESVLEKLDWMLMDSLKWDKSISNSAILDTMHLDLSFWDRRVALQTIKLYRTSTIQFKGYILGNLPIMMIFIVPLYGLVLKWFFDFKDRLYIHHLIHSLHLHSFSYLAYSVAIVFMLFISEPTFVATLAGLSLLGVSAYFFKSMRVIYQLSFRATLWRLLLSGFLYILFLIVFLTILLLISFLLI